MKYDKMIALNKVESEQKIKLAQQAIDKLIEKGEYPSVTTLVKMTGLSRGFFYKNKEVREWLDKSIQRKNGRVQRIWKRQDESGNGELFDLRMEIIKQREENETLNEENQMLRTQVNNLQQTIEKLQKKLDKKAIALLKKL